VLTRVDSFVPNISKPVRAKTISTAGRLMMQNTDTVLDFYRTPHTEKLHVVERWRKVKNGRIIEVVFTVDDPETQYDRQCAAM
jgi:hypothetical protein